MHHWPYAPVTLGFLIEDYVVHLKHHLGKIEERVGLGGASNVVEVAIAGTLLVESKALPVHAGAQRAGNCDFADSLIAAPPGFGARLEERWEIRRRVRSARGVDRRTLLLGQSW